jgi:hypothetical protein
MLPTNAANQCCQSMLPTNAVCGMMLLLDKGLLFDPAVLSRFLMLPCLSAKDDVCMDAETR